MRCPACQTPLVAHGYHDLALDYCPACGGLWLDHGEVERTVDRLISDGQVADPALSLDKDIRSNQVTGEPDRACPRCAVTLEKFNYAYDSNVILDRCLLCRGVWADGDEINQVASYSKGNPTLIKMGESLAEFYEEKTMSHDMAKQKGAAYDRHRVWPGPIIPMPIGVANKTGTTPLVVMVLVALNIVVFLLTFRGGAEVFSSYGIAPANLVSPRGALQLFSSLFIHVDIMHLAGNMLFLALFGVNIANRTGPWRFLLLYLLCGAAAVATHSFLHAGAARPLIGASGAISGLMGVFYVWFPRTRIDSLFMGRVVKIPASWYLAGWVIIQVGSAVLSTVSPAYSNVAFGAHLGGFAAGYLVAKRYAALPAGGPSPVSS